MAMKSGNFLKSVGLFAAGCLFAGSVYAGSEPAPPSSPFRLVQPSIKGTMVFLPAASCLGEPIGCEKADLTLVGSCQKEPVQLFYPEFPIDAFLGAGEDITSITDTGLDGRYLEFFFIGVINPQDPNIPAGYVGDNSNLVGVCDTDPSMAVTSVNGFVNRNGFINADITLKFAPPR